MKTKTNLVGYRRHVPQRTCVACRQVRDKRDMVRLVRGADSNVEVDDSGRKAGRGAYLCRKAECWEVGLNGNRVEYALHSNLTPANREELANYGRTLR